MEIKIGFNNPNANAEGIRVYRDVTPLDVNNLPAPLDSIAGNATFYLDQAVERGITYYYIFETFLGEQTVRTGNIQASASSFTGPGSQTFLRDGDMHAGCFGLVPAAEFITWDAFRSWTGMTFTATNPNTDHQWLKFAHKGKILFVSSQPLGWMTWNLLYASGLVYGVDGPGPREYNTLPVVNQMRTIQIQGFNFKARLMTALPPNFDLSYTPSAWNTAAGTIVTPSAGSVNNPGALDSTLDYSGSEWNDLMIPLISWAPISQKSGKWAVYDTALANNNSATWVGMKADHHFQEMISTKAIMTRGTGPNTSYHPGYASAIASTTSGVYYRPVLEMIP